MIYAVHKQTKEHQVAGPHSRTLRRDYDLVPADADGWIEWHGGECPLPDGQMCEVWFRLLHKPPPAHPTNYRWNHAINGEIPALDIIAYRPILDPQPTEWNGEGLPPVGTVCECMPTGAWVECKVVAHRDGCAVAWVDKGKRPCAPVLKARHFRPIRTDREKWINAATEYFCDDDGAATMEFIYDALKSGELPQP